MGLHYFHFSDGVDLVIDRIGHEGAARHGLDRMAAEAAEGMMRELPDYDEWESWSVYVYDEFGEVDIVPFPPPRRLAA